MEMTLKEFLEEVESGFFTDDDGFGEWIDENNNKTKKYFYPSEIFTVGFVSNCSKYPKLIWYNR